MKILMKRLMKNVNKDVNEGFDMMMLSKLCADGLEVVAMLEQETPGVVCNAQGCSPPAKPRSGHGPVLHPSHPVGLNSEF